MDLVAIALSNEASARQYRRNIRVESCINLAYKIGGKFFSLHPAGFKLQSFDDAGQVAMLGLIYAAERFDESKGFAFTTYASRCIYCFLQNEAMDAGTIRTPRSYKYKHGFQTYMKQAKQAEHVGELPCNDNGEIELADRVKDPADIAENDDLIDTVLLKLEAMPARIADVLLSHFAYEEPHPRIGKRYGVSRARSQQIAVDGLEVLRQEMVKVCG